MGQKLGVNNCPSFYLGWCKQLEENEIDRTNFDQLHLPSKRRFLIKVSGILIEPSKMGLLHISGYMRIQVACSSISLIYHMILKESKATSIPNYEGIEMLENRIRERMLEYSRVFNIESAYIPLNFQNQAVCSSTRSVEKEIYYAR